MANVDLRSPFAGALMGTFVGDALGAPFEGRPSAYVADNWNSARSMIESRRGCGAYTDDTQMMIGVAKSLAACGGFNGEDMARCFVDNYEPHRGYGGGARLVLSALAQGCPWDRAATIVFPDGSFGNGAAMRVAPVGVFCHHDLAKLREVAEASASITHAHPLGKEGAALQACAVALATRTRGGSLDPPKFLAELKAFVHSDREPFPEKLLAIGELLRSAPSINEVVALLGNDVSSMTAVPAAIYAFLSRPDSFQETVTYAILLGGDTDTIGAMGGAIAGAYHGAQGIPSEWLDPLENGGKGRDYVLRLAFNLYERHLALREAPQAESPE
jgi:poly(ADP-ribose) glycohydrolase ARH3